MRLPGQGLHPGGDVHRVADHGVGDPVARAHVADAHGAGVDPDPHLHRGRAAAGEVRPQACEGLLHLHRRPHGVLRVARVAQRSAPEGHQRVADVLVDGPAVAVDHLGQWREDVVQELDQLARLEPLGDGGEVADVREEHRHLPGLAVHGEALRVLREGLGHLGRHVLAEAGGELPAVAGLEDVARQHLQGEDHQGREQRVLHRHQGHRLRACEAEVHGRCHGGEREQGRLQRPERRQGQRQDQAGGGQGQELGARERLVERDLVRRPGQEQREHHQPCDRLQGVAGTVDLAAGAAALAGHGVSTQGSARGV